MTRRDREPFRLLSKMMSFIDLAAPWKFDWVEHSSRVGWHERTSKVFSQIGTLRVVRLPQPQVLHPLHSPQMVCVSLAARPPIQTQVCIDSTCNTRSAARPALLSAHAPVCFPRRSCQAHKRTSICLTVALAGASLLNSANTRSHSALSRRTTSAVAPALTRAMTLLLWHAHVLNSRMPAR